MIVLSCIVGAAVLWGLWQLWLGERLWPRPRPLLADRSIQITTITLRSITTGEVQTFRVPPGGTYLVPQGGPWRVESVEVRAW